MFSVRDESTNKNVNKTKKTNKFKKNNKNIFSFISIKFFIILIILLICFFILSLFLYTNIFSRGKYLKDIVYISETGDYDTSVNAIPYINLDSSTIEYLNDVIYKDAIEVLNISNNSVNYFYYENTDILSLVIKYDIYENDLSYPKYSYVSYNIDIDSGKILDNDKILDEFNFSVDNVSLSIENKLRSYYSEFVKDGYLDSQLCTYDCFINKIGVNSYVDNISYFIINNKLYVYRYFDFNALNIREDVFNDSYFLIKINK